MKITIDTTNKTVQVNDAVTLDELLCTLESLGIDYVEYKLIQSYQIISYPQTNFPETPWDGSTVYYKEPSLTSISMSTSSINKNSPDKETKSRNLCNKIH